MPLPEYQKRASLKYDKEHMMVLGCKVRKEYAAHCKAVAKQNGTTISAIFLQALRDFLAEHDAPYEHLK